MNELTNLEINKPIIISTFKEFGIQAITVSYNGCGDSGQVDDYEVIYENGKPIDIKSINKRVEYFESKFRAENGRFWTENEGTVGTFEQFIDHIIYAFLEDKAPGWEINDGSYGDITIKADGTGQMIHTTRIEETNEYTL
jgi:hypothetical protein